MVKVESNLLSYKGTISQLYKGWCCN